MAALVHGGGAGEERPDIDAGQCSGQKPDCGQHAEPAADVGRDGQRGNALVIGDTAEYAAFGVGREDEMTAIVIVVEGGPQSLAHDHELRHRLRRRTRLADDVVERGARIEAVEQRSDRGRIHVVEDVQVREVFARVIVELVPVRLEQCVLERDRAESRATDPEHDNGVVRLTEAVGKAADLLDNRLLVREREEAELPRTPPPLDVGVCIAEPCGDAVELFFTDAASASGRREHAAVIQADPVAHRYPFIRVCRRRDRPRRARRRAAAYPRESRAADGGSCG